MPSARTSTIPSVVAGLAIALTAVTYARLEALKSDLTDAELQGAVIATEDIHFLNTSEKPEGCLRSNSGRLLCFEETPIVASGTYALKGTIQMKHASGAVLLDASIECGSVSSETSFWFTEETTNKVTSDASTGSNILRSRVIATAGSINGTGAYVDGGGFNRIGEDAYIFVLSNSGAQAATDCLLKTVTRDAYGT